VGDMTYAQGIPNEDYVFHTSCFSMLGSEIVSQHNFLSLMKLKDIETKEHPRDKGDHSPQ
jgi:hypothetical protein